MPELPDVEGFRRYVARYGRGREVQRVRVMDHDIVRNTSPQGLGRAVSGHRLGDPERRGKWLVAPVDDSRLVLHFGMTGDLSWSTRPGPPGDHDRLRLELDGGALTYRAQRKLGGVWLAGGDWDVDQITGPLGPDAASVDRHALVELLDGRRGRIKAALMDQELIAGIGNELSDEILWRARIHPGRPVGELSDEDTTRLYDAMAGAVRESVRHGRIPTGDGWFKSVRGDDDARCPRCGHGVATERTGGRTAWLCPSCQR